MNRRKLQRRKKDKNVSKLNTDRLISTKAAKTAEAAVKGEPTIDCVGNFIFFSTSSGEAWLLDHRHSYALRLADDHTVLSYRINESKDRFQVEWKERFRLENDTFIASRKGEETVFDDYPVDAIEGLINMIRRQNKTRTSPAR